MIMQPQLVLPEQNQDNIDMSETELVFLMAKSDPNILQFPFSHQGLPAFFSHQVSRTPKKLIVHVQRIYYCFKENLPEQLYAALVDLFIALQGRRKGLCRRMFNGSKQRLTGDDSKVLDAFFKKTDIDVNQLPVNHYSVLCTGRVGTTQLIESSAEDDTIEHDPLMLARDFIEYSQLEEAREVLETAVEEQPDDRALHEELLDLYKSTRDTVNFQRMYQHVKNQENPLLQLWDQFKPLLED